MTDTPQLSPAQSGIMDEQDLRLTGWQEADEGAHAICANAEGEVVMIAPDGTILDPVVDPEIIHGEAEEITEGEAEDFKPPEIVLAVDSADPADVFRAMDRADEVAILDELEGRAVDTMIYSFDDKTDLTVVGVRETIRLMNERGYRIGVANQPPIVNTREQGDETYFEVMVYALDARNGVGYWGLALEPEYMKAGQGKKWDKFALTKALNKAQRNACKAHIPEEFRQAMIALYFKENRVKRLKPLGVTETMAELPAPVQGPDADRVRAEIAEVWKQLRELTRGTGYTKMAPGGYNNLLARTGSESVERLEDMKRHLEQLLEEEIERQRQAAEEAAK